MNNACHFKASAVPTNLQAKFTLLSYFANYMDKHLLKVSFLIKIKEGLQIRVGSVLWLMVGKLGSEARGLGSIPVELIMPLSAVTRHLKKCRSSRG